MARNRRLTDTAIRNTKHRDKPFKVFDERGLYLLVTPDGGKWWRFKYRFAGKEKLLSLGVYPDVRLQEARDRRDDARKEVAAGLDPSAMRQAAKQAQVVAQQRHRDWFESIAREWFEKFSGSWVPEHAHTVIHRLETDIFPWIGRRPVSEVAAVELLEVLRRIEARGAVSIAHRLKQACGQVFRYAIATGRASRDPSADLRGALTPERERHFGALTTPAEAAALMRAIDGYQGSFIVRCALRFTALTFARPGEIRKAEWSEIDFVEALWRIPAERMKMRREHLVPLSVQAVNVLTELRPLTGAGRYVFPNGRTVTRPMSENAILAALRSMGYERGQMTAHGFRSIASTLLNEQGWPADVIERQLAHAERDSVRNAYNRAQYLVERRRMMQVWAEQLDQLKEQGVFTQSTVSNETSAASGNAGRITPGRS
jgi:integrase